MRQLFPTPADQVDVYQAYQPADPSADLVRINMVMAADGRIVDSEGVSGQLGGAGDTQSFFAMRHVADGIVAGAGTVRAEGYGPMKIRENWRARREADGRVAPAAIVVVTRSMDLDVSGRLFTQAVTPTIVLTTANAPMGQVQAIRDRGGVVIQAGQDDVDLGTGLRVLREDHGLSHLLLEGGPTLNGQVIAAGLADELCLTLAPTLAGGPDSKRIVDGLVGRRDLILLRVLEADGELLLTYRLAQNNRSSSDSMPRNSL
ncbi:MAG: dihydrofolate reductase family protein [Euzebya sp.]